MRYQFFTVRCADPGSDCERLNAFLAAHPILSDDYLLFAADKEALLALRSAFADYLSERLELTIKPPLIQRCERGFLFCGVRIRPHALRPSQRRRRRYRAALRLWEQRWRAGEIDAGALSMSGGSTNQRPVRLRPPCASGQTQGPRRGSRPMVETLPLGRFLLARLPTPRCPHRTMQGGHAL